MNIFQAISGLQQEQPKFKQIFTPQERWKKHLNIVQGNPNRVSVVVEFKMKGVVKIKKPYFLLGLEKSCSIAELNANIRQILGTEEKQSLFLYCGKMLPGGHEKIKNFEKFIQPDGFLYFVAADQQAFG